MRRWRRLHDRDLRLGRSLAAASDAKISPWPRRARGDHEQALRVSSAALEAAVAGELPRVGRRATLARALAEEGQDPSAA